MRKKKSILKMFLIPLSIVMLIQAAVAFGAVYAGGTVRHLDDYSVGIMEQIVKNRNLILSGNMTHQWTDISGEYEIANTGFEQILEKRGLTPDEFMGDETAKREFLEQMVTPGLDILRRNGVNGIYVVLADGLSQWQEERGEAVYKCSGIYFRDSDPYVNPKDYSDLLMERGNFGFSHDLGIPFDYLWTSKFAFRPEGALEDDNFFYKPYRAALENPGAGKESLAYWSRIFYLEGNREKDSYSMISYSVPLISAGEVYGVMGIEISSSVIGGLLPYRELNSGEDSGYLLAEYDDEGNMVPFFLSGSSLKKNLEKGRPLKLQETDYRDFYQMDLQEDGQRYYAQIVPFSIYGPNTPFVENNWVLMGVQSESSLFGLGNRITRNIALAVLISLAVGITSICFLMRYLTRPITRLADWIREARQGGRGDYQESNITEISALYDAVSDLTEKQKMAEAKALEEKERYLLALQSSTDIIYTYNVEDNSIDIYNLFADRKKNEQGSHIVNVTENIQQNKILYDEDRQLLKKTFLRLDDRFELEFRANTNAKGWQWMEISGKAIIDASGKKSKIIGSIRNVQAQKEKEQMETKAARIDPVTGLYRENVGREIIRREVESGQSGFLMVMDLDKFQEMNDRYGIEFGDAVLEEMGIFILKLKRESEKSGKRLKSVRAGGDEILTWFCGYERDEMHAIFNRMNKMLYGLSSGGELDISVTAAVEWIDGKQKDYRKSMERLRAALSYGKRRRKSELTFCEEVPETERTEKRDYNEIASNGNTRALNMVTRVFNLFDRGGRVGPIISVLFAKMGVVYRLTSIIMAEIRWDFNASGLYKQWHRQEGSEEEDSVCHYKTREIEDCSRLFLFGYVIFGEDNRLSETERRILHIPAGTSGLCAPMYDGGKLMGAISFIRQAGDNHWTGEECSELQEVVKIIETNVNRERYDLASRAKSDFLSRMSHEIRTPMNAIIGMTAIAIEKESQRKEVKDCLVKIDQSSRYLLSLINDILDMSKIESGKMRLSCEAGDIIRLADEIEDLMEGQIAEKNIDYQRDICVTNPWIQADFMRLKQVIINLFSNAVKFTQEGGQIRFTVREQGAERAVSTENGEVEICFAVEDSGIGISPENRERIFNAFEQAETNTATSYGGTGLGLSISSRLVRMMGGEIELESREGEGSRFSFTLRFAAAGETAEAESADDGAAGDIADGRILLVEDNALNTEIAKQLLEMHGLTVDTAENGKEGADKFADSPEGAYNLILMDIRMPVMDGLEATKTIRRMNRRDAVTIPIIAMTANAFDEDMKKSIESGMNGHLAKPVDAKELIDTIKSVINNSCPVLPEHNPPDKIS